MCASGVSYYIVVLVYIFILTFIRQWADLIKQSVISKREEFGCVSLSNLSLEPNLISSPRRQRFYRSRSHGHLVDDRYGDIYHDVEEDHDEVDYKKCLIQHDEDEHDRIESLESDFQQRLFLTKRVNQFRKYS